MYPDPDVTELINKEFIPVRVHAREQKDEFQRLGQRFEAQWTPTTIVVDPDGKARHRIEGFLPKRDFLSQLELGLAHSAFARGQFEEAQRRFDEVGERYPDSDAAAEAQYWTGVSRYKATGDAAALQQTAQRFSERYADSAWAKKASVWRS